MQLQRIVHAAAIAATAALAACNSEPEVVTVNRFDPQAEALKNAGPVEAPPMIVANHAYRCSDNSLYFVAFLSNNTANIRTSELSTVGMPSSVVRMFAVLLLRKATK